MMWIFAAAMALMLQAGEWLAMPMPDGFVTVEAQSSSAGSIERRVPRGEALNAWTQMITLITYNNPNEPDPYTYLAALHARIGKNCPGFREAPPAETRVGTLTGFDGFIYCPKDPVSGEPVMAFHRVAGANGRLYVVRIEISGAPTVDDMRWGQSLLNSAAICPARSTRPPCVRVQVRPL